MHPSIANAAEVLYRNAAAIRAVEGREMNPFTRALEALERLADAIDAPIALVGGLAGIHHRAMVTTLDIEVVPAGRKSPRDPAYAPATPSPQELGVERGLGYASFAGWVALKLVANREKDRYHLIEALKQASESAVASAVLNLRRIDPTYLKEFQRLFQAAQDEKQEDW